MILPNRTTLIDNKALRNAKTYKMKDCNANYKNVRYIKKKYTSRNIHFLIFIQIIQYLIFPVELV